MLKNTITKNDPQNQFKVLKESYMQVDDAWKNKVDLSKIETINLSAVLICGLGGSAISGELLSDFLSDEIKIPIIVNRNYSLPSFINKNWLVIISSYSGNTEETVSCFEHALKMNVKIVVISSDGKVEKIANQNSIKHIKIKSGFQPRYALGLGFFTLLKIFQELKLIKKQDEIVISISKLWKERADEYSLKENNALKIAEKLVGFIPVIYSSGHLSSAGYRFKCQLNENSKVHAFHHIIPEMNHNEIIGWETQTEKKFNPKIIFLHDNEYHSQIKKRYSVFSEFAASKGVEVISLTSSEKNFRVRIMDLIYLSDWISFYLAVLRGFDPSEIDFICEMKKRLV
ncbi:MAG: bifunctional phosphoglucose/phosphomannose isomerase [Ignavibacteria bacterium]|nr:bifunctional phosphoglucose/phosphomannose isomerase [Ignavibacteria bacterium]NNL20319.1 bifunctional phosphoglucose/phosphomannose isomerase [Ignavibacteriaceae bacterium]